MLEQHFDHIITYSFQIPSNFINQLSYFPTVCSLDAMASNFHGKLNKMERMEREREREREDRKERRKEDLQN
jgi:hypothetical protein